MAKITACIISFNEEQKIEACLASLEGIADEIVLVDSHSTDRTREIAARYTDRIYEQTFLGYVRQKGLAYEHATHDWVLNLDCDERLSPKLREAILAEKEHLGRYSAYRMTRRTFYVYRWLDYCWYPEFRVRLFDRRHCRSGGKEPHDKILVEQGEIGMLPGDICHYSFDSISDHIRTLDNFTEIAARDMLESGKRVSAVSPFTHGAWTFLRLYVVKRGFLDGFAGIVACSLSGVHVFVKYAKVVTGQYLRAGAREERARKGVCER